MKQTFGYVLASLAALAGCASTGAAGPTAHASLLTVEHFRSSASIRDDALDVAATISTEPGWQPAPNPIVGRVHDTFLRASVVKADGVAAIQAYTWIRYPGSGWRNYITANYETSGGPAVANVDRLGNPDVDCSLRALGCVYRENLGFLVPEATLREWSATHRGGTAVEWKFKLTARSGDVYNGTLPWAEVTGLLQRLDDYRASRGLAAPNATPPKE